VLVSRTSIKRCPVISYEDPHTHKRVLDYIVQPTDKTADALIEAEPWQLALRFRSASADSPITNGAISSIVTPCNGRRLSG